MRERPRAVDRESRATGKAERVTASLGGARGAEMVTGGSGIAESSRSRVENQEPRTTGGAWRYGENREGLRTTGKYLVVREYLENHRESLVARKEM